ncbi:hypothetical protein CMI47_13110 [Candidatus Pacearchaeota archaeon]|nr:hypothetical protein [Candidatus Pacearchaeota archaeon]|tara:strand:+ start:20105 stop:20386 length:282 start_codon:yes stop_codon:yes gene_type:complete
MKHCTYCNSEEFEIDDHLEWCLECGEPRTQTRFKTQSEHILYELKKEICDEKAFFENIWDVQWWMHTNGKSNIGYYQCDICNGYHLTRRRNNA